MGIYNPANVPVISKITIGSETYYLKDAEVRTLLATLGTAAQKDASTVGVAAGEEGLVTGAQVQSAIAGLSGAMHFVGVKTEVPATYDGKSGDVILVGTKEYVYDGNQKTFVELGDEGIYALKDTTIAGIDLQDNISVAELQGALGLHAMAYANTASGNVNAQNITGVKATGTSAGDITVGLTQTSTAATVTAVPYTPEGTVSGTTTAAGSVALAASTAEDAFQVTGSVTAPTITVTPSEATVSHVTKAGSAASFTEGAFSQGTLPSFTQGAKADWSASVDANETLSFSWTANGDDQFSKGTLPTKAADEFTANVVPEFSDVKVVGSITDAKASAPTFTGGKIAASFTGASANISATFAGTEKPNAIVTGVNYDKATIDEAATGFTGAALNLDVGTITVPAHSVTVSPDAVTTPNA